MFPGGRQPPNEAFILGALEESLPAYKGWPQPKPADLPLGRALEGMTDDEVRAAALTLLEHLGNLKGPQVHFHRCDLVSRTLSAIGRKKRAWTPEEALRAVTLATNGRMDWYCLPIIGFVAAVLKRAGGCPEPAAVERYLQRLSWSLPPSEASKAFTRLRPFSPAPQGNVDVRIVEDGDEWGREVRRLLGALDDPTGIDALLSHLTASGTQPTKRWLSRMTGLVDGAPAAPALLRKMAAAVLEIDMQPGRHGYVPETLFSGANADLARGAMFGLALTDPSSAPLLGDLACHAGAISPGSGVARDAKVAIGSVAALGLLGTDDAVGALARAQQRVKNRNVRKQITRSLHEAAAATGIGVDELLERAVPRHGLGPGGTRDELLGEDLVRLAVDADKVRLFVAQPNGGWRATVPARLREGHGRRLDELRTTAGEASKTLSAEKARLEGLLAAGRTWGVGDWARLYRDHPLTGAYTGRLLWVVGEPPAAVRLEGDVFIDIEGAVVAPGDGAPIRLWHPIDVPAAEVQRWRTMLSDLERRQPFKQAWREVYLLTPAEVDTETYTNRFAAHILRFNQAFALMKTRDWAASALGAWDGGYEGSATKVFPGGGWRATFLYDLVETQDEAFATPTLCSTDQVYFEALVDGRWARALLGIVPSLVFSEAMRDVDLFVGVASIAADPTWVDRTDDRHLAYWHQASFGDLTETAETRRAALERLLPRTKIAGRAWIDGHFLCVKGRLRSYRIHIGSGNILMEPNDQYLCIVPARRAPRDRFFLPFEEDGGRMSLILSKAFLLAEDDKITDHSIVAQINRR